MAGARANAAGSVYEADCLTPSQWDREVADFADASLDQTALYADALRGARRNSHIVVRSGGGIVAAARVFVLAAPLVPAGLAYVKFGPMWRRKGAAQDIGALRAAVEALVAEYCERRRLHLSVALRPSAAVNRIEGEVLSGAGFRLRGPSRDPHRYLVRVDADRERARGSLAQKWRYNLKKAEAVGLEIGFADDPAGIERFTRLHAAMVARKKASAGDPVHLLPQLAGLPEPIRPRVVLAWHEGSPVCGAVIAVFGDTAYYLWGASDDRALPLNAGYALHWWILGWLATTGTQAYDLGGEVGAEGLRQFKKGLVGRDGDIVEMPGEFVLCNSAASRLFAGGLFHTRALLGTFNTSLNKASARLAGAKRPT